MQLALQGTSKAGTTVGKPMQKTRSAGLRPIQAAQAKSLDVNFRSLSQLVKRVEGAGHRAAGAHEVVHAFCRELPASAGI